MKKINVYREKAFAGGAIPYYLVVGIDINLYKTIFKNIIKKIDYDQFENKNDRYNFIEKNINEELDGKKIKIFSIKNDERNTYEIDDDIEYIFVTDGNLYIHSILPSVYSNLFILGKNEKEVNLVIKTKFKINGNDIIIKER